MHSGPSILCGIAATKSQFQGLIGAHTSFGNRKFPLLRGKRDTHIGPLGWEVLVNRLVNPISVWIEALNAFKTFN
jgi:hypothetical protein